MSLPPRSPASQISRIFAVSDTETLQTLCGPHHRNLERLEQRLEDYQLRAESQGGGIMLFGLAEGVSIAEFALGAYLQKVTSGTAPGELEFDGAINGALSRLMQSAGPIKGLKVKVQAQTAGQTAYLSALQNEEAGLVFGVGPAGTGKTFLAVAIGAAELATGRRDRLIVARPAVEAGEKLGFLPGDLEDKVDPYMLPSGIHCASCSVRNNSTVAAFEVKSRSHRSPSCVVVRSKTRSLLSTKRRTPPFRR